jgi:hypothetical protein
MAFKPAKKAVNRRRKDVGAPSTPKTTHAKAISVPKSTHHPNRIKNLGKFAHPPSKLPKMGVTVKAKHKSKQVRGY